MFTLDESDERLEIRYQMRTGSRVFFFLAALFPLIAPYELLWKVRWENLWNVYFLFAALICLGALAVSGIALMAALAGLSSRLIFDRQARTFTYTRSAPVFHPRPEVFSLANLLSVEVEKHDWSDSAPDYSLRVNLAGGRKCSSGMSSSQGEVEGYRQRVLAFLAWPEARA